MAIIERPESDRDDEAIRRIARAAMTFEAWWPSRPNSGAGTPIEGARDRALVELGWDAARAQPVAITPETWQAERTRLYAEIEELKGLANSAAKWRGMAEAKGTGPVDPIGPESLTVEALQGALMNNTLNTDQRSKLFGMLAASNVSTLPKGWRLDDARETEPGIVELGAVNEDGEFYGFVTVDTDNYLQPKEAMPIARAIIAALAAAPAVHARPTIKGASIDGGYVIVTPAGWGNDKAVKVRDAIFAAFPVDPKFTPRPDAAMQRTIQDDGKGER